MSETKSFHVTNLNLHNLTEALTDWYKSQGFKTQVLNIAGGGRLIQASQEGALRNIVGMSSALNVALRHNGEELTVEIGAGKWLDKAVVAGIAWFVLWPLLFTAAYGAWQQSNLPKLTLEFIEQFVSIETTSPAPSTVKRSGAEASSRTVATPVESSYRFCGNCGASVSEIDRFCIRCGGKLT